MELTGFVILFKDGIAMNDNFLIINKFMQIFFIKLRKNDINKLSSHLASVVDKVVSVGCNHNERVATNVIAQSLIFFHIGFHGFASALPESATDFLGQIVIILGKFAMNSKKILFKFY